MNYGLITIYILSFLNLLVYANQHGKPRDACNFWVGALGTTIQFLLIWWALGWVFW